MGFSCRTCGRELIERACLGTDLTDPLEPSDLTGDEFQEAQALWQAKYAREDWTFPCRRHVTTSLAARALSGVVLLDLELEDDRISALDVRGDFLLERQETLAAFCRSAIGLGIPEVLQDLSGRALPTDPAAPAGSPAGLPAHGPLQDDPGDAEDRPGRVPRPGAAGHLLRRGIPRRDPAPGRRA